ncbi:MAG: diguanylate cyclase, partial [Thermoleophilia bacterium]
YLAEPHGQSFRVRATVGEYPEYDRELFRRPVPKRIWDELFLAKHRVGSSYFIDHRRHLWTQEQLQFLPPLDLGPRAADEWHKDDSLLVPLLDKQRRLMGVLGLYDPDDRRQPTLELVTSLEVFATHAAVAIENARQYEQLEATKAQLEGQLTLRQQLIQLSTALLSTLDLTDVFRQITTMLKEIVDYDAMDIRLVDDGARELVCIYARDENAEKVERFRVPLGEGVSGWVVRHDEAQLVNDMLHDPRIVQVPGTAEDEPQASIVVPLRVRGKVTGVLCLDRLSGRTFEAHELEPVKLFANLAAIAIENARSYKEMERQAISDGLTGIHNYRHFQETLQAEVSRAERYGETFCLLMMDLDHFKAVNDTIGHQKGDDVLRAVSTVLRGCSRESDYLARYGGEEFVVILPNTELEEARSLAERVRASVADLDPGHPDLHVTMSIGVAAFPESANDSDGVLGAADAALLRAKAQGRDRVCLFSDGQNEITAALEGELVALGRHFAAFLGLSESEAAGLVTALAVHETGTTVQEEVQVILGSGHNGDAQPNEVRRSAVDALVYGNERWDGSGYPEGRSGSAIPRVARAFAVCRRWETVAHSGARVDGLRDVAAKELDPQMVQRFTAMLRMEKVTQN